MSTATERLAALGLELPPVPAPVAAYIPAIRVGDQIWTSGQLPTRDGNLQETGIVGAPGQPGGRHRDSAAGRTQRASPRPPRWPVGSTRSGGSLKAVVYVASDPAFVAQPQVANGASKLLGEVIGSAHARSAVGVAVLPLNAPVEVEIVVEV